MSKDEYQDGAILKDGKVIGHSRKKKTSIGDKGALYAEDYDFNTPEQATENMKRDINNFLQFGDGPEELSSLMFIAKRNNGEHIVLSHNINKQDALDAAFNAGRAIAHRPAQDLVSAEAYDVLLKVLYKMDKMFMLGMSVELPKEDRHFFEVAAEKICNELEDKD